MTTQPTGRPTIRRGKEGGAAAWIEKAEAVVQTQVDANAEWLEKAAAAQVQASLDKAAFDAEDTSTEVLTAFMDRFEGPIQGIVSDLRGAGYVVDENGPDLLFDGQKGRKRNYSKVDPREVYWTNGYSYTNYYSFGREWIVRKFGVHEEDRRDDGFGDDIVATIRLHPTRGKRTHFAGAEYAVWNGGARDDSYEVTSVAKMSVAELEAEDKGTAAFGRVAEALQEFVGGLVVKDRVEQLTQKGPRSSRA
jgi:ribosomal protein L24E